MLIDAFKYNTLILRLLKKLPCSTHLAALSTCASRLRCVLADSIMLVCYSTGHLSLVSPTDVFSAQSSSRAVLCRACPIYNCRLRVHFQCICRFVTVLGGREASAFACAVIVQQELVCLPLSFSSADIDTETMNEWHAWIMWWLGWLGVILERSILSRSLWQRL